MTANGTCTASPDGKHHPSGPAGWWCGWCSEELGPAPGRASGAAAPSTDMPAGTWVAKFLNDDEPRPAIGRVKEAHEDGTLDIVIYSSNGDRVGRVSPAMGGPRGFEPCCAGEFWEPIQAPDFDIIADKFFFGQHLVRLRAR